MRGETQEGLGTALSSPRVGQVGSKSKKKSADPPACWTKQWQSIRCNSNIALAKCQWNDHENVEESKQARQSPETSQDVLAFTPDQKKTNSKVGGGAAARTMAVPPVAMITLILSDAIMSCTKGIDGSSTHWIKPAGAPAASAALARCCAACSETRLAAGSALTTICNIFWSDKQDWCGALFAFIGKVSVSHKFLFKT